MEKYRTTLNLKLSTIAILRYSEVHTRVSISELISRCIVKKIERESGDMSFHPERTVQYQPYDNSYEKLHVDFDKTIYDLNVNFRIFCRLSVSLIASQAINSYLDEVVAEIIQNDNEISNNKTDNYFLSVYQFNKNHINFDSFWVVIWAKSKEQLKKPQKNLFDE